MTICPAGHETAATDYCDLCGVALEATPASAPAGSPEPPASAPAAAASAETTCPNCSADTDPDALFCEACGYDFTTGAMPEPVTPLAPPSLDLGGGGDEPAEPAADASTPAQTAPPAEHQPRHTASLAPSKGGSDADALNPAPALEEQWVAEVWIDPQWYASQSSPDPLPSAGPPRVVPLRHTSLLVGRASASRGITPDVDCGVDNGVSRRHAQLTTDGTRWWIEDLDSSNGTYVSDAVGELPTQAIKARQKVELSPEARIYLGSWTRLAVRQADPGEI